MFSAVMVSLCLAPSLDDAAGDLAADVADFALEIADAGFAGVVANDGGDGIVGEDDVLFSEAGGFALLPDEVLLGDFELFRSV